MNEPIRFWIGGYTMSRRFTDNDTALIIESLRIAQQQLLESSVALERMWPSSPMVERLVLFAEQMADVRERLQTS